MKISPNERKVIGRGMMIVVPALLYVWGVLPYHVALTDARERLAVEQQALARERGAVATARRNPELQHLTDSVLHAIEPRLFEGRDDVMTSSELAAYLGDVAFDSHVWMEDASTRPVTMSTTGVRTLHVEVRAESDFRGVLSFLQNLEQGNKFVRIERIDISRGLNGVGNENAETLLLSATIAGYALGSGSGATPAKFPVTPNSARGQ